MPKKFRKLDRVEDQETEDLSDVPKEDVVAVAVADVHLSDNRPACRSERDWFGAMRTTLDSIAEISREYEAPLIVAGDLFDRWKSSPALINLVMEAWWNVKVFGVPGQHDLPYHDYERLNQSAYGVLVKAGLICNLEPFLPRFVSVSKCRKLALTGFPWGTNLQPAPAMVCDLSIAVVHKYIWANEKHPGASEHDQCSRILDALDGYNVIVSGDHHAQFVARRHKKKGLGSYLFNCGPALCRTLKEKALSPRVGLITKDGLVLERFLGIPGEWIDEDELSKRLEEGSDEDFLQMLKDSHEAGTSFKAAVKFILQKVSPGVRQIIKQVMEWSEK